jgi:hypothetical protein
MKSTKPILTILAVLLASSVIYGYFQITKGSPKIEVIPDFKDLGDIPKEGFNYTFIVKNSGDAQLKIAKVTTSCGCTLASIERDNIPSGGEARLHVTFNPKFMKEEIRGPVSRTIFVKSNDPEAPDLEIKIWVELG